MIEKLAKYQNWAKATPFLGLAAGILLFVFTDHTQPIFWALINIPLYFFHQMEEHYLPGGFKRYVNTIVNKLPEGQEVLTDIQVFWINILLVWVAFIVFGALAVINVGFGTLIIIFSIINCLTHIGMAIRQRDWNPGLLVASIQFVVSIYAAYYVSAFGNIEYLAVWWIAAAVFSIVAHIWLFRVLRVKKKDTSKTD